MSAPQPVHAGIVGAEAEPARAADRTVLFVGPLPPPRQGMSMWSAALQRDGLGPAYALRFLDSSTPVEDVHRTGLRPARIRRALRLAGQLAAAIRRDRPDIVHVSSSTTRLGMVQDAVLLAVARLHGCAAVLHLHGAGIESNTASAGGALPYRLACRIADHTIALTDASLERAARWSRGGRGGASILWNYVPREFFEVQRDAADDRAALRVLFVGFVREAKGAFDLLEALAEVPGVEGHFCGFVEPGGADRLRALLARPELAGRVHLHGQVGADELRALLRRADLFTLPSHTEACPISLIEAMAAGLPALVSEVGAMPAMVPQGGGWTVPARDRARLAAALREAAALDRVRLRAMGETNRAAARRLFQRASFRDSLDRVYTAVLERAR